MTKRWTTITFAVLATLVLAASAAGASATLFGAATKQKRAVRLVSDFSDSATANDFSGIDFKNTRVTTFSSLRRLSTRYNVTDDSCGGGSPRFQINVGGKNVFVYIGPAPTFTACPPNSWLGTGNLIGNNDPCRWDTSQIVPGTQCNTYAGTLALIGTQAVTGIQLVVDGGWFFADKEQTVLVCGIRINGHLFFPCRGRAKGDDRNGDKITICHHAGKKRVTITISRSAWPAHRDHGDTMGRCP
jgi:hypothetical protein